MHLPAEMRDGDHGILSAEWQQFRVRPLHLARELVVFACFCVYTDYALA